MDMCRGGNGNILAPKMLNMELSERRKSPQRRFSDVVYGGMQQEMEVDDPLW